MNSEILEATMESSLNANLSNDLLDLGGRPLATAAAAAAAATTAAAVRTTAAATTAAVATSAARSSTKRKAPTIDHSLSR